MFGWPLSSRITFSCPKYSNVTQILGCAKVHFNNLFIYFDSLHLCHFLCSLKPTLSPTRYSTNMPLLQPDVKEEDIHEGKTSNHVKSTYLNSLVCTFLKLLCLLISFPQIFSCSFTLLDTETIDTIMPLNQSQSTPLQ